MLVSRQRASLVNFLCLLEEAYGSTVAMDKFEDFEKRWHQGLCMLERDFSVSFQVRTPNPSILSKLDSVGVNVVVKPSDKKIIITANDEHVEIIGTINDLTVGDESSEKWRPETDHGISICSAHRYQYGIRWRPKVRSGFVRYPTTSNSKAQRGMSAPMCEAVQLSWGILCRVGTEKEQNRKRRPLCGEANTNLRNFLSKNFLVLPNEDDVICDTCRRKYYREEQAQVNTPTVLTSDTNANDPDFMPPSAPKRAKLSSSLSISLPISSTLKGHAQCCLCKQRGQKLMVVHQEARFNTFLEKNIIIPAGSRCCPRHLCTEGFTKEANEDITSVYTVTGFNHSGLLELIDTIREHALKNKNTRFDFDKSSLNDTDFRNLTGLTITDFEDLCSDIPNSAIRDTRVQSMRTCIDAAGARQRKADPPVRDKAYLWHLCTNEYMDSDITLSEWQRIGGEMCILDINALLTPRQRNKIVFNRFVKLKGGESNNNIDGDLVMELLNIYANSKDNIKSELALLSGSTTEDDEIEDFFPSRMNSLENFIQWGIKLEEKPSRKKLKLEFRKCRDSAVNICKKKLLPIKPASSTDPNLTASSTDRSNILPSTPSIFEERSHSPSTSLNADRRNILPPTPSILAERSHLPFTSSTADRSNIMSSTPLILNILMVMDLGKNRLFKNEVAKVWDEDVDNKYFIAKVFGIDITYGDVTLSKTQTGSQTKVMDASLTYIARSEMNKGNIKVRHQLVSSTNNIINGRSVPGRHEKIVNPLKGKVVFLNLFGETANQKRTVLLNWRLANLSRNFIFIAKMIPAMECKRSQILDIYTTTMASKKEIPEAWKGKEDKVWTGPYSGYKERTWRVSDRDVACPVPECPVITRHLREHALADHLSPMFETKFSRKVMQDQRFQRFRGHMVILLARWLTGQEDITSAEFVLWLQQ
ncbi:unnamed protein product [Mytilus coruscus]|uniref:Uncharacterized protein n=1 Tax=Mytilus coruscus TaxID=42192 RepID=A0A6J8CGV8_MYTCO|nr:unnamed protein product [Mytilus coruscus]